jgi:ABC-type dipeptide/oligopeptide/nickel transport system permease subunit
MAEPVHFTPRQLAWRRFLRNRAAVVSAVIVILVMIAAIVGPIVSPYEFDQISDHLHDQFQPPSAAHWFGTDVHGRDVLTRVLHGARVSLMVGAVATMVSLVIGVIWGAVAGYVGGRIDSLMMRFVDILYTMPYIIFVIVLITTLDDLLKMFFAAAGFPSLADNSRLLFLFVGLGAVSWLTMARIVRGQVLTLKTRQFIESARAQGAGTWHIVRYHLLPNTWGIVIAYLTLTLPGVILMESFLSFLGLGIQPPQASWGSLIADGATMITPLKINWWLVIGPGGTMAVTLLALNFLGDGLRDALDPRGRTDRS